MVRVACAREDRVTIEQVAFDFEVHPMTPQKWLRRAAVDDVARPGQTSTESAELLRHGAVSVDERRC